MRSKFIVMLVLSAIFLNGNLRAGEGEADANQLKGKWRGIFQTATGGEVPFNFEVLEQGGKLSVILLNAAERYQAGDLRLRKDSVYIDLQMFDNELALQLTGSGILSGVLRRQDGKGNPLPVRAVKGVSYRFLEHGTVPVKNISGRYDVVFSPGTSREEKAVAVLKQEGNRVFGSFLRVTGDSRYLEGLIEGDEVQLSSFIGSSPAYYKAKVQANGSLQGENLGLRSTGTPFVATFNERAALPDAFTLTELRKEEQAFTFSFPDASGKLVGIDDERFRNKPLIIAIGGTWCPNCMDEASFLGKWYKDHAGKGIEVVGLQFERDTSLVFVKNTFTRFSKRYGINYPLLLGGVADKQVVTQKLPVLANFISFPTTIFLDRNKNVKKIHTGFSGPATGRDYDLFVKEFNEIAADLLK